MSNGIVMSDERIRLSCASVETYLTCRQKYYWRYVCKLVPKRKPVPMQVGSILHHLLSLHIQGMLTPDAIGSLDELVQMISPSNEEVVSMEVAHEAAQLVLGYIDKYRNDPLNFVATEVHVEYAPPDEEFSIYGRVDALARSQRGDLWRVEFKSVGRYDAAFLAGQKSSLQHAIYTYLLRQTSPEPVRGTVFDLIIKSRPPQYERAFVPVNPKLVDMALSAFRNVARSIRSGEPIFPSMKCWSWNRQCDYHVLCMYDSPENREAFFENADVVFERERMQLNPHVG